MRFGFQVAASGAEIPRYFQNKLYVIDGTSNYECATSTSCNWFGPAVADNFLVADGCQDVAVKFYDIFEEIKNQVVQP